MDVIVTVMLAAAGACGAQVPSEMGTDAVAPAEGAAVRAPVERTELRTPVTEEAAPAAADDQTTAPAIASEPAEAPAKTPIPKMRDEDSRRAFWRMLASLLVVLVLLAVAAVVGKKFLPRMAARGKRQLRLLETLHVAPKNTVHLMKVGNRIFMLGSGKEGLTTLGDVTDAVTAGQDAAEGQGSV